MFYNIFKLNYIIYLESDMNLNSNQTLSDIPSM